MGKKAGVFRKPGPIDAIEDGMREFIDVFVLKVLSAGQDSAEQNRRVNGRDLGVPHSLASVEVGKVKKESAVRRQLVPQVRQGLHNAQSRFSMADKAALITDADGRKSKTRRCNTGSETGVFDMRTLQRSLIRPV